MRATPRRWIRLDVPQLARLRAHLAALAAIATTTGLVGATSPGGERAGLYRSQFERGLAALAAGENEAAADAFRAAGDLAPDAPVWRAYLARAEGREPEVELDQSPSELGPWALVPHRAADAAFDPTGERLISGYDPATLWDARSGERIAVLRNRGRGGGRRWQFDITGRFLIGLGSSREQNVLVRQGIDVRDARTGAPIEIHGAAGMALREDTRFQWVPPGTTIAPSAARHAFQIPLPNGFLRCIRPPIESSASFVVRADGARAVCLSAEPESMLHLVDPRKGSTLLRIRPGGQRALFSPGGRFLASKGRDRIVLADAGRGQQLPSPPELERGRSNAFHCGFDGDLLVVADRWGHCYWWDPGGAREVRSIRLDPAPGIGFADIAATSGDASLLVLARGEVRCHDSASGTMIWSQDSLLSSLDKHVSVNVKRILNPRHAGRLHVLDANSGANIADLAGGLGVMDFEPLIGEQAALLSLSDGSLRRVGLRSGRATASVTPPKSSPRWWAQSLDQDRIISWADHEALSLRDARSLRPSFSVPLEDDERVLAVAEDGSRFITVGLAGTLHLRSFAENEEALAVLSTPERPRFAAFSKDASQAAVVGQSKILLLDAGTTSLVASISTEDDAALGPVAFYGHDRLMIGWHKGESVGVDVLQLPGGERLARLDVSDICIFGGNVEALRCFPDLGCVVFSVSTFGIVAAFRAEDWSRAWLLDSAGRDLDRPIGTDRLCMSGLPGRTARVVDIESGTDSYPEPFEGCSDLKGSQGCEVVAGVFDGQLGVFDGESAKRLYVRSEGADDSAWIVRDGKTLEVDGERGWETSSRHLERGGISYPADCWDAWILDPLGLVRAPLDVLPQPPLIVSGPPRVVLAQGEQVELVLEIESEAPLLGVQVEIAGRPTELAGVDKSPVSQRATGVITITAPWPADLRLRAVARSGVLSAPWRVRIEPFQ